MSANLSGSRTVNSPDDNVVIEPTPTITPTPVVAASGTPVAAPVGASRVAVYDRDTVPTTDPTLQSGPIMTDDGEPIDLPAEGRSAGSIMMWIIGVIVLIVLAYFLLQVLF
jgi:hypothetical protein